MFLRLYLAHGDEEARNAPFDTNYHADVPIESEGIPAIAEMMAIMQKKCLTRDNERGKLDTFGMVVRLDHPGYPAVYAMKIVEKTTITDSRQEFGHENTETVVTTKENGLLHFIFGEIVAIEKVRELAEWVQGQKRLGPNERDEKGFNERGVSIHTANSAQEVLAGGKFTRVIKMGPATFIGFDAARMSFAPLQ